jgi:hypothetical protein
VVLTVVLVVVQAVVQGFLLDRAFQDKEIMVAVLEPFSLKA